MSDPAFNAAEIGLAIAQTLESRNVEYALGGALAYGVWALPRATKDVDLNLFVAPEQLPDALDALAAAGVAFDRTEARRQRRGSSSAGWVPAGSTSSPPAFRSPGRP